MIQTLQLTKRLRIVPLVSLQSDDFSWWYRQGVWRSLLERKDHNPQHDTSFADYLVQGIERNAYIDPTNRTLARDVAYWPGMIHGGVLTDIGTIREGVTTLVQLQNTDCINGYKGGREYFFQYAATHKAQTNEESCLECIQGVVDHYPKVPNVEVTRYIVTHLLGEVSGNLFPWTIEEQRAYIERQERMFATERL